MSTYKKIYFIGGCFYASYPFESPKKANIIVKEKKTKMGIDLYVEIYVRIYLVLLLKAAHLFLLNDLMARSYQLLAWSIYIISLYLTYQINSSYKAKGSEVLEVGCSSRTERAEVQTTTSLSHHLIICSMNSMKIEAIILSFYL